MNTKIVVISLAFLLSAPVAFSQTTTISPNTNLQVSPVTPTAPTLSPEVIEKIKQKLAEIEKLSPEQRTKALQEFQDKLMKEQGINPPPQPSTDAGNSTVRPTPSSTGAITPPGQPSSSTIPPALPIPSTQPSAGTNSTTSP